MQRLILMRHADAERASGSGRDQDRTLSPRGRADALAMGRALATRGARPDLALV
jgi:phosphohistidine phosphatase